MMNQRQNPIPSLTRAKGKILRRAVTATVFSLSLIANLQAIDLDVRFAGRYAAGGGVSEVAVLGSYAYAVSSEWNLTGLRVFDLSGGSNPVLVGQYYTSGRATGVAIAGNFAYVVGEGRLTVLDVSNPELPRWWGLCDISQGDAVRVAVSGEYACVANGYAGLQIINVSNPASPKALGRFHTSGWADSVAVSGHYAYFTESLPAPPGGVGKSRLWVIDLSDPANPRDLARLDPGNEIPHMALSGDYLYLTETQTRNIDGTIVVASAGLRVFDIRDPANPELAGAYDGNYPLGHLIVSGSYAYATYYVTDEDAGLEVFDLGNGTSPRLVGRYAGQRPLSSVAMSGQHAVVGTAIGLEVVSVTNPAMPERVGTYAASPEVHQLIVSGVDGYALEGRCPPKVCGGAEQLEVIDLSNPAKPRAKGVYRSTNWIYGLALSGSYAYLAEGSRWDWTNEVTGGLRVIDIRNGDRPKLVGTCQTAGALLAVAVSGRYGCVVEESRWDGTNRVAGGLHVIDLSDPADPRRLGSYQDCDRAGFVCGGDTLFLAMSGTRAYLAGSNHGLDLIDLSDPASPRWLSTYKRSGAIQDLLIFNGYAYISGESGEVIDVRNPANLQSVGPYDGGGYLAIAGDHLYSGFELFDLSDLGNPATGGDDVASGCANRVAVSANHLFLADGDLQVFETAPANPQRVGEAKINGRQVAAVWGRLAYVTTWTNTLHIVDIGDPANPRLVGSYYPVGEFVEEVAVSGQYAYLAESPQWYAGKGLVGGGLRVIDVADPSHPRPVGLLEAGYFRHVAVSGAYAYITDSGGANGPGLLVMDISNPAKPYLVATWGTARAAWCVVVSGRYAYVTEDQAGFHVIDITDPRKPERVGGYDAHGLGLSSLQVAGDYAYVTDQVPGLQVIDVRDPKNPREVGRDETGAAGIPTTRGGQLAGVSGAYAYVNGEYGLVVMDISNPTQLRRVGGNSSGSGQLILSGNYLFGNGRTSGGFGLVILDQFRSPHLVSGRSPAPEMFRLWIDGPRGVSTVLQRSSNLLNWQDWQTVTYAATPVEVRDPEAAADPRRFYRCVTR